MLEAPSDCSSKILPKGFVPSGSQSHRQVLVHVARSSTTPPLSLSTRRQHLCSCFSPHKRQSCSYQKLLTLPKIRLNRTYSFSSLLLIGRCKLLMNYSRQPRFPRTFTAPSSSFHPISDPKSSIHCRAAPRQIELDRHVNHLPPVPNDSPPSTWKGRCQRSVPVVDRLLIQPSRPFAKIGFVLTSCFSLT